MVLQDHVRDYQRVVFEEAQDKNVIAILPTNSGKTRIASLLTHHYLSLPKYFDKCVIFLAPTVVLAGQQATALHKDILDIFTGLLFKHPNKSVCADQEWFYLTPEPKDLLRCFAGNVGTADLDLNVSWNRLDTWQEYWDDLRHYKKTADKAIETDAPPDKLNEILPYRRKLISTEEMLKAFEEAGVTRRGQDDEMEDDEGEDSIALPVWPRLFVMPPDKLLIYLQHAMIRIEDVSLLIFDECHHTASDSAYTVIAQEFYHKAAVFRQGTDDPSKLIRPRILGLTASPIAHSVDTRYAEANTTQSVAGQVLEELKRMCQIYQATVNIGTVDVSDPQSCCWSRNRPTQIPVVYPSYSTQRAWIALLEWCIIFPMRTLINNQWCLPEPSRQERRYRCTGKPAADFTCAREDVQCHGILMKELELDPLYELVYEGYNDGFSAIGKEAKRAIDRVGAYRYIIITLEEILKIARDRVTVMETTLSRSRNKDRRILERARQLKINPDKLAELAAKGAAMMAEDTIGEGSKSMTAAGEEGNVARHQELLKAEMEELGGDTQQASGRSRFEMTTATVVKIAPIPESSIPLKEPPRSSSVDSNSPPQTGGVPQRIDGESKTEPSGVEGVVAEPVNGEKAKDAAEGATQGVPAQEAPESATEGATKEGTTEGAAEGAEQKSASAVAGERVAGEAEVVKSDTGAGDAVAGGGDGFVRIERRRRGGRADPSIPLSPGHETKAQEQAAATLNMARDVAKRKAESMAQKEENLARQRALHEQIRVSLRDAIRRIRDTMIEVDDGRRQVDEKVKAALQNAEDDDITQWSGWADRFSEIVKDIGFWGIHHLLLSWWPPVIAQLYAHYEGDMVSKIAAHVDSVYGGERISQASLKQTFHSVSELMELPERTVIAVGTRPEHEDLLRNVIIQEREMNEQIKYRMILLNKAVRARHRRKTRHQAVDGPMDVSHMLDLQKLDPLIDAVTAADNRKNKHLLRRFAAMVDDPEKRKQLLSEMLNLCEGVTAEHQIRNVRLEMEESHNLQMGNLMALIEALPNLIKLCQSLSRASQRWVALLLYQALLHRRHELIDGLLRVPEVPITSILFDEEYKQERGFPPLGRNEHHMIAPKTKVAEELVRSIIQQTAQGNISPGAMGTQARMKMHEQYSQRLQLVQTSIEEGLGALGLNNDLYGIAEQDTELERRGDLIDSDDSGKSQMSQGHGFEEAPYAQDRDPSDGSSRHSSLKSSDSDILESEETSLRSRTHEDSSTSFLGSSGSSPSEDITSREKRERRHRYRADDEESASSSESSSISESSSSDSESSSAESDSSSDKSPPRRYMRRRNRSGYSDDEDENDSDADRPVREDNVDSPGNAFVRARLVPNETRRDRRRFAPVGLHSEAPTSVVGPGATDDAVSDHTGADRGSTTRNLNFQSILSRKRIEIILKCNGADLRTKHDETMMSIKSKCIVFCTTRLKCKLVAEYLAVRFAGKCSWVTGLSATQVGHVADLTATSIKRLTHLDAAVPNLNLSEQTQRLHAFRSEFEDPLALQTIAATSIIEEGFDLPACNAVVRYDLPQTLSQFLQSRGRARKSNSKFYLMSQRSNFAPVAYLEGFEHLEKLVLRTCERIRQLNRPAVLLSKALNDVKSNSIYNEKSAALIPWTRALQTLESLLTALAAIKDSNGSHTEESLRRFLRTVASEGLLAARSWNRNFLRIRLPPMYGHRSAGDGPAPPLYKFVQLQELVADRGLARNVVAGQLLIELQRHNVLDDWFLPPQGQAPVFGFRQYKAKTTPEGPHDILWRETPLPLIAPDWILYSHERALKSSDIRFICMPEGLRTGAMKMVGSKMPAGIPGDNEATLTAVYQGMKGLSAAQQVQSSKIWIQQQQAAIDEEVERRSDIEREEQKPADDSHVVRVMYPHHVYFRVERWDSEVLKSGGLFGFWRLHHNPSSANNPPEHMIDFASGGGTEFSPERTVLGLDVMRDENNEDTEGANGRGHGPEEGEEEQDEVIRKKVSIDDARRLRDQNIDLYSRWLIARAYGKKIRERMDHIAHSGQSEQCCRFPGIRLVPHSDPLTVLQPCAILLHSPIPEPLEYSFIHWVTQEIVHVKIQAITVGLLKGMQWSDRHYCTNVDDAIDEHYYTVHPGADRKSPTKPPADPNRSPVAIQVSAEIMATLHRYRAHMTRLWGISAFSFPLGHHLVQDGDFEAVRAALWTSDAKIPLLTPPFCCQVPLKADGVTLDLEWVYRFIRLFNFTRSGNERQQQSALEIESIRRSAPPTMKEMYDADPQLIAWMNPDQFDPGLQSSIGEAWAQETELLQGSVPMSCFACSHRREPCGCAETEHDISCSKNDRMTCGRDDPFGYVVSRLAADSQLRRGQADFLEIGPVRPIIALWKKPRRRIDHEDVVIPELTFIYSIHDADTKSKWACTFDEKYRGEFIGREPERVSKMGFGLLAHNLARGGEAPLLRLTYDRSRFYRYYRLSGFDWESGPEARYTEEGELTLCQWYEQVFKKTVDSDTKFCILGDRARQGPRTCFHEDKFERSDPWHAPQFARLLPFPEVMMTQWSYSTAAFWMLDVRMKQRELISLLRATFNSSTPLLRVPNSVPTQSPQSLLWQRETVDNGTVTMTVPMQPNFSIDATMIHAALTSSSSLGNFANHFIETIKKQNAICDLFMGRTSGFSAPQGLFWIMPDTDDAESFKKYLSALARHEDSPFEQRIREVLQINLMKRGFQPNASPLATPDVLLRYFPPVYMRFPHNQVLEFLGDSVLKYIATVWAYFAFPDSGEGRMSQAADTIKANASLRAGVRQNRLHAYMLARPFNAKAGRRGNGSIADMRFQEVAEKQQADVLESLIGAIYWSHYHRIDMWPSASLHLILDDCMTKMAAAGHRTVTLDDFRALATPYLLHPAWCGSPSGAYAAGLIVDAFVLQIKQPNQTSMVSILSAIRDLAAVIAIDGTMLNSEVRRTHSSPIPSIFDDVAAYKDVLPKLDGSECAIDFGFTNTPCVTTRQKQYGTEVSPVSHERINARFRPLDREANQVMMREFPTLMGGTDVVLDFDTNEMIKTHIRQYLDVTDQKPRDSNMKFLKLWFSAIPGKDWVRRDVYAKVCEARIEPSAKHFFHPTYTWGDYQRLEYLGDAALALLMTEWLNKTFFDAREGHLSVVRGILQSNRYLTRVMLRKMLGQDSEPTDDSWRPHILPSRLMYYEGTPHDKRWRELDMLQVQLRGIPQAEDFYECKKEIDDEQILKYGIIARSPNESPKNADLETDGVDAPLPRGDPAQDNIPPVLPTLSFNKHKCIADCYEAMVGVTLFEYCFDLRAVWEVIKGDFIAVLPAIEKAMTDDTFIRDVLAVERQRLIEELEAREHEEDDQEQDHHTEE